MDGLSVMRNCLHSSCLVYSQHMIPSCVTLIAAFSARAEAKLKLCHYPSTPIITVPYHSLLIASEIVPVFGQYL